jgi:hypothetical protein
MAKDGSKKNEALEGLDPSKRATLSRLATGAAFAAPVVASFTMQGLAIRPAHAASSAPVSNT